MIINSAYKPAFETDKRYLFFMGSGGSGKSVAIAQKKVLRVISYPYAKEIILRKNFVSLKDSCYSLIGEVISNENINYMFDFTVSPLKIVHRDTGNEFLFRGMKDEKDREKVKSINMPTGAWFEELTEFERKDLLQVDIRIRGEYDIPKEVACSFNPTDEDIWINQEIYQNNTNIGDYLFIHTTYEDNKFIDDEYKKILVSLKDIDENYYNVYALGKWGSQDSRGLIYKNFLESKNVLPCPINPHLPLILYCDFNVDPMKWGFGQIDRGTVKAVAEIVKADTDTASMCEEATRLKLIPQIVHGDYSGTFRHTSSRSTDYDIIKQYFPNVQVKVKPNPAVIDRINSVNMMLYNKQTDTRRLFIDPSCKHLINDFKKVKFVEGKREEDKSQEKYDGKNTMNALVHMSSAMGYLVEYEFGLRGKAKISTNMF